MILKKFFKLTDIDLPIYITFIFFLIAIFIGPASLNLTYLIFIILFIYKIYNKEINLVYNLNSIIILQILFCAYLIINSYFINYNDQINEKSLFFFRFFLLSFVISKFLINKKNTIKFISLVFYLCSILLCFDILLQYNTGFDIFSFKAGLCGYPEGGEYYSPKNCERFSGFFGDEYIAGNFLSTYGLFFFYLYFRSLDKNIKTHILSILSTIILLLGIIISGERNALINIIIILLFNCFFNEKLRKYLLFIIIIFIITFVFSIKKINHIKYRYFEWPVEYVGLQQGNNILEKFIHTAWGRHYITAYEIFISNKITGSGFKSFRIECNKENYDFKYLNKKYELQLISTGCSTHPHNMYFEILSETGLIGFIIFCSIIYFLIFDKYFKNSKNLKDKTSTLLILSILVAFLFPFRPTGSFSSSVFATNLWFFIGFYLYFVKKLKHKI